MAAQLSHEMHQRMESEARLRHLDEWSRTNSEMSSQKREEARIAELTTLLLEQMSRNKEVRGELFSALALECGGGNDSREALENLMRLEVGSGISECQGRHRLRGAGSERFDGSPRRIVHMPRRGVSTTHMETAELLMRGGSKEEQLAMCRRRMRDRESLAFRNV
jgi:hypothetical protein